MIYKDIKISNFRNILDSFICPHESINIICGENAQGKTNFLESLYFNSYLKSFRTKNMSYLINNKSENSRILFKIENGQVENKASIKIDREKNKYIEVNNKVPDRKVFYGLTRTIIYYPEEINLLGLYPQYRRNLIDRSIFILDSSYLDIVKRYTRILKQRNIFLKDYKNHYDIWKEKLIDTSIEIIKKRIKYIEDINNFFVNLFTDEEYKVKYKNYESYDLEEISSKLKENFEKTKESEKKCGYTLVGPHTDDIRFTINGMDIKNFASEGQKKTFLLTYKNSEISLFKNKMSYYPILIMDDISNELDELRKNKILDEFLKVPCQKFITSTEIPKSMNGEYKIFHVSNGEISEKIQ